MANFDLDCDFSDFSDSDFNDRDNESDVSFHLRLSSSEESDNEEPDLTTFNLPPADRWTIDDDIRPNPRQDFTGPTPGPTVTITREFEEIDFWNLFFTIEMVKLVVERTNLFAERVLGNDWVAKFTPVTEDEMKAWLGVRVVMSVHPYYSIEEYWSEDCLYGGHRLANIMSRDRFQKIDQYLHVSDDTRYVPRGQPGHDKLFKVRELLEMLRNRCLAIFNPNQNTSVDEAMIAFKGRLGFLQYVPGKPTKYGIKVWMRADPNNGYVNDFQVYTGKENGTAEVGLGVRVVRDLMMPVRDRQHVVNCDNFFMSPQLCSAMRDIGTYVRGTVRPNRKDFPKDILNAKHVKTRGEMRCAQKGDMLAVVWRDKRVVHFLSTGDDPAHVRDSVMKRQLDGSMREVECPSVMKAYNKNMNGVDRADQLRMDFPTYRTSRKWWRYLFWFIFDIAVCNAFVLMRDSTEHQLRSRTNRSKARTQKQFRQALSKQLISKYGSRKRKRLANEDSMGKSHWSIRVPNRVRCRECSSVGKRSDVRQKCLECDVGLCVNCFKPFHEKLFKRPRLR